MTSGPEAAGERGWAKVLALAQNAVMPNGPTAFLRFTVDEFASILKALPPDDQAEASFPSGHPTPHPMTVGEMLQHVLSGNRSRVVVEEQYGSSYIVHLGGHVDPGGEGERHFIGVHPASPLFVAIRQRHHSADHP